MILSAFDIETWGAKDLYALQPWRMRDGESWVTSVAYTNPSVWSGKRNTACDLGFKPDREVVRTLLQSTAEQGHTLLGANIMFDAAWMIAWGLEEEVFANRWLDFQHLWKRVDPFRYSYSLKQYVREYLPKFAGYEEDVNYGATTPREIKKLIYYNKLDVKFTLHAGNKFWKMLSKSERQSALIEARGIPEVAKSWVEGINMDIDYLHNIKSDFEADVLSALYELNSDIVERGLPEVDETVLASPTKLRRILYKAWGLRAPKYTEKGAESTDKEALIRLGADHPEARLILNIRTAKNRLSKFVESPIASLEYNDMLHTHPTPWIAGTYTGRMTYTSKQGKNKGERPTGIALHQWARPAKVRRSITAPDGYVIVELDFSGQEMRLMADRVAVLTGDTIMLDLFLDGMDMHAYMGAGIDGHEYEWVVENKEGAAKQCRYLGKFANLSLQYRVGIDTMIARALTGYDLWLTYKRAEEVKTAYLSTYPGVPQYWNAAIQLGRSQGYAETMGHRRVPVRNMREWKHQQTAINTPIQGTGADMKQLALALLGPKIRKMGGWFSWDLHDALFMYMPDNSELMSNIKELKHKMSNLPYKKAWGWEPLLPLPADGTYGYRWGELRGF